MKSSNDNIHFSNLYITNKNQLMQQFFNDYWEILHIVSYLYPNIPSYDQQMQIEMLIESIHYSIPCGICKEHFSRYVNSIHIPDIYKNKESLISFFIDLHNSINKRNSKKIWKRKEVDILYSNLDQRIQKFKNSKKIDIRKLLEMNQIYRFIEKI